jgi:hypothetical protein
LIMPRQDLRMVRMILSCLVNAKDKLVRMVDKACGWYV